MGSVPMHQYHPPMRTPLALKNDESRDTWLFWLTATVILFAGLGLRDPWPADEPRFALVARQMVESGQWLFPMRGDELYPDKPPLFMWLQAAFYAVTGNLRIAFLLPSLLASLGTLWLVRDLGRRLWSAQAGHYAAWALLLALQFTWQSKRAQIDPTVTFFITLSVYSLLRHLLRGPDWRFWSLGWFAAGLGVITKGVGVVALLVLLPAAWAQWRGWSGIATMRSAKFWLGPVALLLPLALWLLPMLLAVNASDDPALRAYADNILLKQTAKRYADPWHHHQPAWYFIQVALTQWLPTVAVLPWMLRPWRDALRARDARILLPLAWVLLVIVFFSLSSGKREVYIMPALPMLCLAMGPYLHDVLAKAWPRRIAFGLALALSALLAIAGAMVVWGEPGFERTLEEARGVAHGADPLGAMLLAIGAFGLAAVAWLRARRGVAALVWVLAGLWVGVSLIGYPLLNDASSARGLMQATGARIGPDAELGLVGWKEQNLLMADRPAKTFGFLRPFDEQLRDARAWQAQAPATRWLQVEATALDDCIDRSRAINLGISNRREWWLVPAAAMCASGQPQVR
ncbi:4-amino-4-deoxy-L-arabinose transferase-like glycosyltransferase [Lysobacter ruishenii]|uniref:4-amino-4-deoxy-L-arabinose transferase-like glycosyltransferase n=2 Tax=Aerolutibacter ruishenii TaxID=686800 RepID=A0A562M3C7_9GAMM|nr:4-amino-4-deoxy-L-arabinose transferase-like glycosyltransferase [Lysobacter ruishenii]